MRRHLLPFRRKTRFYTEGMQTRALHKMIFFQGNHENVEEFTMRFKVALEI